MALNLYSKFKGSMIGALLGDCLGCPFEVDSGILLGNSFNMDFSYEDDRVPTEVLGAVFEKLLSGEHNQILPYTDDTVLSLCIASSLVDKGRVDAEDLARRYVNEFYSQPSRGYGGNVVSVFRTLKITDFKDVFLPGKMQFNGSGSYGNGAAMRIGPIALFSAHKEDSFIRKAVEDSSFITHTHPDGWIGALLQCFAVHEALRMDPAKPLNPVDFIDRLRDRLIGVGIKENDSKYFEALQKMLSPNDITPAQMADYLGNDVSALKSVPTAIYSFLRGFKPIPDFECSNPFIRTMHFAISCGGDTDTIASMAGSISGAYFGIETIPDVLQKRCECIEEVNSLAEKLYHCVESSEKKD